MLPSYSKQQESYSIEGESTQNNIEKKVHVQFFVPQSVVGVIIGKGGSMIKKIEEQFDVKLFIDNIGEAQTLIGMYGPKDGIQNATSTIMKLLLSLPIIRTKLDEMGKPRTLRYVEEMTFLSLPKAGPPAWFVNLEKERIQLENGDKKKAKQTETAKTDRTESHTEEVPRGRPKLKSPVPPIKPEKSAKSKSKAPPCLFKVKVVPKTESGLPHDRYETEAIALSVRTPVNYGLMVGTLRAGVENLPENFNLSMKIDKEWMKIPRPKNNENDAEIWDEYFVNQPKGSRVLYLVDMPKVEKTKPGQEKSGTELAKKNTKTETELQALADEMKTLKRELACEKMKNIRQRRDNEEKDKKLCELNEELETVKEKSERLEQLEKSHQLLKWILRCTVCYSVQKDVVFCGGCGRFTSCARCATAMTDLKCPICRTRWSPQLDGRMGKSTNVFKDVLRVNDYFRDTLVSSSAASEPSLDDRNRQSVAERMLENRGAPGVSEATTQQPARRNPLMTFREELDAFRKELLDNSRE